MRTEEAFPDDHVIPFRRRRAEHLTEGDRREEPTAAEHAEAAHSTVVNAEQGIVNTGTVHGGQHRTAIEFSGHFHSGAGDDV